MKKFILTLLLLSSLFCFVSCKETETQPVTPEPTPVVVYAIEYNTFGITASPEKVEGVLELPATLPVLSVEGYDFEGWYYDQAFTTKANPQDKLSCNVILYAKFTEVIDPGILDDIVFDSITELYEKGKTYSISATNIPNGVIVEYEGNNVTGAGNHLVIAKFYNSNHKLIGTLSSYINVVYQLEFPEI